MSAPATQGDGDWDQLMSLFREEAGERTRRLETDLADDVPPQGDGLEPLRREAHALKGTAAVLGLEELAELAGAIEDSLRDTVASNVEAVPRATAAFREGVDAAARGERMPESVGTATEELRSTEPESGR